MRNSDDSNVENSIRTYVQVLTLLSLLFFALSAWGDSKTPRDVVEMERGRLEAERHLSAACPNGITRHFLHQRDPRVNPRAIPEFDNSENPPVVGIPWRLMKAPRPTIGSTYLIPIQTPDRRFSCKATEVYSTETCEVAYVVHFGGTPAADQTIRAELVKLRSKTPDIGNLMPHAGSIDPNRKSDAFVSASFEALAAQIKMPEQAPYWTLSNYRGRSWIGLPVTLQSGTPWDFCDEQEVETVRKIVENP